jgi:hypothetical protein
LAPTPRHLRIGDVGVVNSITENRRPKCLFDLPVKADESHGARHRIHSGHHQSPAPEPGGNRLHLPGGWTKVCCELLGRQPSMIRGRIAVLKVSFELGQLRAAVQCHYHFKLDRLTVRQFAGKRDVVDVVADDRRVRLRHHDPATNRQYRDYANDQRGISTAEPGVGRAAVPAINPVSPL